MRLLLTKKARAVQSQARQAQRRYNSTNTLSPGLYGPVAIVQEAGWVSGLVWMGPSSVALKGFRNPDRPACSVLQYRLSYRGRR
jgi:hypothetical protein